MINKLPVFLSDPKTKEILQEAAFAVPNGTKVYIVGGAARNAVYYKIFKKRLPQRDYDLLIIGNRPRYIKNLRKSGFIYGRIRRKTNIVVKKEKVENPSNLSDYVFLDMKFSDKDIIKNLEENANFTINGFALELRYAFRPDWFAKTVKFSTGMRDMKARKLRINKITHPANLYSCIRFMSQGFIQPSNKEVNELFKSLGHLEKWRFKRNIEKVFDYVGGEQNARKLAMKLGIKRNIFDFKTILAIRKEVKKNPDLILV